ncbi:endonuclease domain-containing protein [Streptomyces sp. NPDC058620]|uniref:endonuclease domain-containing protein n=1 Tax=Streptomyces sp. NPDC058620 TaxID=3346560 RepID=UPI003651F194
MWWRLCELQDGRCATCDDSPATFDHDHCDGSARGLLRISCNRLEAECARRRRRCFHEPPHFFEGHWRHAPAKLLEIQVGSGYHHRSLSTGCLFFNLSCCSVLAERENCGACGHHTGQTGDHD